MSAFTQNSHKEPSYYFNDINYQGTLPKYYSRDSFNWVASLESQYETIRKELLQIISGDFEFNRNINPPAGTNPENWTNMYFYNFLWKNHDVSARFPLTEKIISSIPGVIFAGIAVLKPHTEVKPHTGETDATIRCHFGVDIPGQLPLCGTRVGGEERPWENGKVLLFTDAYTHSTWNYTDKNRVIILFDVVREEYMDKKYEIACNCLASLSIKALRARFNIFSSIKGQAIHFIHFIFYVFWFLFLPIQRTILKDKIFAP